MATDNRMTRKPNNTMGWVIAGALFLGIVGMIIWSMTDRTTTAANNPDSNSGSISKTAPAPGDRQAPPPGNPARP
jgi:hypothetical protein